MGLGTGLGSSSSSLRSCLFSSLYFWTSSWSILASSLASEVFYSSLRIILFNSKISSPSLLFYFSNNLLASLRFMGAFSKINSTILRISPVFNKTIPYNFSEPFFSSNSIFSSPRERRTFSRFKNIWVTYGGRLSWLNLALNCKTPSIGIIWISSSSFSRAAMSW